MAKKLKVALMSYPMDNRPDKGTGRYTRRLIEELLKHTDVEWTLVHFERVEEPLYRETREILMPQFRFPFGTHFIRLMLFFWKYRREQFDIVHWFQPRPYPFFWLAPAKHIVITAHGGGDVFAPGPMPLSRRMFNFVFRHFHRYFAAVIAVSSAGKQEILDAYHVAPERVHVIYNGGGEDFAPMTQEGARALLHDRSLPEHFILDVSRLSVQKNVATLIRAYELMRDARPQREEHLVVVGGRAAAAEEIYTQAARSSYARDIHFFDNVPDGELNAMYSAADLFVFPSRNEGFGLPVIEAFAAGTPVITSSATSLPEIAGDAAILIDPMDPEAIASAMEQLLNDTSLRRQLIERGAKRAEDFTWRRCAEKTLELYRALA